MDLYNSLKAFNSPDDTLLVRTLTESINLQLKVNTVFSNKVVNFIFWSQIQILHSFFFFFKDKRRDFKNFAFETPGHALIL